VKREGKKRYPRSQVADAMYSLENMRTHQQLGLSTPNIRLPHVPDIFIKITLKKPAITINP